MRAWHPARTHIDKRGAFDKLAEAIRSGHTYVNVHDARWPGSEIRGRINDDSQRQFDRVGW